VRKRLGEGGCDLLRSVDTPALDASGVGDLGEILATEGRAVGLDTSGLHFLLDESESSVVEDDDFDIEFELAESEDVSHEHGEAAVAGEGDDLTGWIGGLHADGLRHGVCHGSVVEGAEQTALAVHAKVAGGPGGGGAHVAEEDGVFGGKVADAFGDILRVDRGLARFANGAVIELLADLAEVLDRVIEVAAFVFSKQRHEGLKGGADIADEADVDLGPTADLLAAKIELDDADPFGEELRVGEVRAEHEEGVAHLHGAVGRRHADETVQADEIGVVVLKVLLAAKCGDDGSLEDLGDSEDLSAGLDAAGSRENCDFFCFIEKIGGAVEAGRGWQDGARGTTYAEVDRWGGALAGEDVAGDDEDGDAALGDGRPHGYGEDAGDLFGAGDDLTEVRAGHEEVFGASLLEVIRAELGAGNLRGDGEDGDAAALTVVQSIYKVEVARTTASRTDGELASDLGLAPGGEGGDLFVSNHHPIDAVVDADGVCEAVEGIPGDPIDALDACFDKRFYEDVGDLGQRFCSPHAWFECDSCWKEVYHRHSISGIFRTHVPGGQYESRCAAITSAATSNGMGTFNTPMEGEGGNPHAGCDVAGAGNGFTVWLLRHSQRKRGETARLDLRNTAPALDPTGKCPQMQERFQVSAGHKAWLHSISFGTCVVSAYCYGVKHRSPGFPQVASVSHQQTGRPAPTCVLHVLHHLANHSP
jgi:hypothetical protein